MDAKTTPEYLKSNALNMPDAIALSYKDDSGNWVRMTWSDFYDVTMKMAKSLIADASARRMLVSAKLTRALSEPRPRQRILLLRPLH